MPSAQGGRLAGSALPRQAEIAGCGWGAALTSLFAGPFVQLEFGGQHAALLCVPK